MVILGLIAIKGLRGANIHHNWNSRFRDFARRLRPLSTNLAHFRLGRHGTDRHDREGKNPFARPWELDAAALVNESRPSPG
jgi:hypothetical protein